uniref:Uncharacterized protein n=1 Tax=uncultured prokaryote TaxID=198431 RepID=A0A0H5Q5N5_9ZZZZ|nr:hypothetical protein [uncultured prokaryote]
MLVMKTRAVAYGARSVVEQHSSCCDNGGCSDPDQYADAHCAHQDHGDVWEAAKCATNQALERLGSRRRLAALHYATARLPL